MTESEPRAGHRATILVAHGSRNPAAQAAHGSLADSVAALLDPEDGRDVTAVAYLELAQPSIGGAIDAAVAGGAGVVRLLPCFLHPGNHVLSDIPAIAEAARARHRGVSVEVMGHLGANPALAELVASMLDT